MANQTNLMSVWGQFRNSVEQKLLSPSPGFTQEETKAILVAMEQLKEVILNPKAGD